MRLTGSQGIRARLTPAKNRSNALFKHVYAYSTRTPLQQYDFNVEQGIIQSDKYQRKMLAGLNTVHSELLDYMPSPAKKGFFGLWGSKSPSYGPKGIYMYGDVGCGKTMLMDMFYSTVPEHLTKTRIHFHGFMQSTHRELHALKAKHGPTADISKMVAEDLAKKATVLCLDEIQVIDVADAMILRTLIKNLYEAGVVTFYTSNREPRDLYKNGVQRESFIPCIDMLEERNHVVYLRSPTDYRKLPRPESGCYYFNDPKKSPEQNKKEASQHADHWFEFFANGETHAEHTSLEIWGRPVRIPRSAGKNVAEFTFMDLCGTFRSAADYLEICRNFPAIVITDVPEMSLEQTDLVRRFITFLDAVYDTHTKLAAEAAKPWDQLFNTKHLTIDSKTNKVVLKGSASGDLMEIKNFTGAEEMFAFARALSRLKHMSSEAWLHQER